MPDLALKIWCLCGAHTGYTCTFEIYKAATDQQDAVGEGQTYNLVMRMLRQADILYKGHHVGMDNFFSSPKLFIFKKMQIVVTGTVRGNRKGLPKQCIKVSERRKGPLLCVSYKDKARHPNVLSTAAKSGYREVTTRRNKVKAKYCLCL